MASNKNQENKAEIATEHAESYEVSGQTQRNGRYIRLIPEPSSDPLDPLVSECLCEYVQDLTINHRTGAWERRFGSCF